jgi:spore germination protein GerM
MTARRAALLVVAVLAVGSLAWGVFVWLERLAAPVPVTDAEGVRPPAPAAADIPHITATLYYAGVDGQSLVRARREVPLAAGTVAQAREILTALLQPAPPPYVSVIPPGTTLRAFYVSDRGEAFVDLSRDVSANHPGGSFTELLTVYAIVNTVTTNLPVIQRVQILIEGREAETLAGHVDLRRPLAPDMTVVRAESGT